MNREEKILLNNRLVNYMSFVIILLGALLVLWLLNNILKFIPYGWIFWGGVILFLIILLVLYSKIKKVRKSMKLD